MSDDDISKEEECLNRESLHKWDEVNKVCIKNIETVEIFLKKPLVGSLAVAIIAYVFAAFLYKIKGMPMVKNTSNNLTANKYVKCTAIDTEKLLFTEHPVNGMVKSSVYEAEKRNKYGKIFWPYLSEIFYPVLNTRKKKGDNKSKGERQGASKNSDNKKLKANYILFLPFYFTLKWTTQLYYSVFGSIKKIFYKADHWGSLREINMINKSLWMKDLMVTFIAIPLLLTMIIPMIFALIIMICLFVAPFRTFSFIITYTTHIRSDDDELWWLKDIGWFLMQIPIAFINGSMMFVLHALWFGTILVGSQEEEADGRKTIIKTWANIIWDYKFIWAILAATLWLSNFRMYLHSDSKKKLKVLDFITPENQEIMLGTIGGALLILLALKQSKYYGALSSTKATPRNCTDGDACDAPSGSSDTGDSKCKNPEYDPTNTRWKRAKEKMRKNMYSMPKMNRLKEFKTSFANEFARKATKTTKAMKAVRSVAKETNRALNLKTSEGNYAQKRKEKEAEIRKEAENQRAAAKRA